MYFQQRVFVCLGLFREYVLPMNIKGMKTILIVDDDVSLCLMLKALFEKNKYKATTVSSIVEAKRAMESCLFHLILTDLRFPDGSGMEIIKYVKDKLPDTPVVLMTAYPKITSAIQFIKLGAYNFISKPICADELLSIAKDAINNKALVNKKEDKILPVFSNYFQGTGKASLDLLKQINLIAPTSISVLIIGESGTGKELIAKMIHENSNRSNGPFVAVDCGAISNELSASEFFGHKKGAFTGAQTDKKGYFESANNGILFLDEIGNLRYSTQIHLLRALQERKIKPVGCNEEISIDVRIIAATNENLFESQKVGSFRSDLFHRLNEFQIVVPPLRDRKEDIMAYANFFLLEANRYLEKSLLGFDKSAEFVFKNYNWPGNLREMKNIIKRAVLLAKRGWITINELPENLYRDSCFAKDKANCTDVEGDIRKVLLLTDNNKSKAARLLNIDRKTLYKKMKQYNIN
nr:sigma-54 dependent transcriptional regulator [uncultured Marinifilum sp.]